MKCSEAEKFCEKDVISCYLYWIGTKEMTDIFSQGYIGITTAPETRIRQHVSNSRNGHGKYHEEFKQVLLSGEYEYVILLEGSIEYCLSMERSLRPALNIGWNNAIGGDGGVVYKHGLTGSKIAKTYYNIRRRAEIEGEEFYEGWMGEGGLLEFSLYYNLLEDKIGNFTLVERGKGYCPENLTKIRQSEIVRRAYRRYDIGDGELYSVADLADKFNMKPNTISSRIRNGWTVREAVGIDYRGTRRLCQK